MMSGHGTIEIAVKAMHKGAYDFIQKPFKTDILLLTLQRAVKSYHLQHENEKLKAHLQEDNPIIGVSACMKKLNETVKKIAKSNSRILIQGQTGTGKELIARLIHQHSERKNNAFITVNCATLDPQKIEEMIFGIEPESSSYKTPIGFFEKAHGGTLYFDEISDMSLATQAQIVQALNTATFKRKYGSTDVKVDIRLICSTSKDLKNLIAQGLFRQDLYYRLNVISIDIPPLKDHREDIPELVAYFNKSYSKLLGITEKNFLPETLLALQLYDWPGNIRQLKNIVERLLIMARGHQTASISKDFLPEEILHPAGDHAKTSTMTDYAMMSLKQARESFEKNYLLMQMKRFNYHISNTAHFIKMERSALHRKLKFLHLDKIEKKHEKIS